MNRRKLLASLMTQLALLLAMVAHPAMAAENGPELQLGVRGRVNFEHRSLGGAPDETSVDLSDSTILLGLRQKLLRSWHGRFVGGFVTTDSDSEIGPIVVNQLFLAVESPRHSALIGRTRSPGFLIDFPTLRQNDSIRLAEVSNPFVDGANHEDTRYANLIRVEHTLGRQLRVNAFGGGYEKSALAPATQVPRFNFNSFGGGISFDAAPSARWSGGRLQQLAAGVLAFSINPEDARTGRDEIMTNVLVSAAVNLRPDPVHFWDLRVQGIYNRGLSGIGVLQDQRDVAQSRSVSVFASVRWLYRRGTSPRAQIALSGGYKRLTRVTDGAQWQAAFSGFYRIGWGFDATAQVGHWHSFKGLQPVYQQHDTRVMVGLAYYFDGSWFSKADTGSPLLGLEHSYTP